MICSRPKARRRLLDAWLTKSLKVAGGLAANVKALTIAYRSFPVRPHLWFPCAVDLRVTGKAAADQGGSSR